MSNCLLIFETPALLKCRVFLKDNWLEDNFYAQQRLKIYGLVDSAKAHEERN